MGDFQQSEEAAEECVEKEEEPNPTNDEEQTIDPQEDRETAGADVTRPRDEPADAAAASSACKEPPDAALRNNEALSADAPAGGPGAERAQEATQQAASQNHQAQLWQEDADPHADDDDSASANSESIMLGQEVLLTQEEQEEEGEHAVEDLWNASTQELEMQPSQEDADPRAGEDDSDTAIPESTLCPAKICR